MTSAPGYCSVPYCIMERNHVYFLLPKDPERAKDWMERCGITKKKSVRICEAHFLKNMFRKSKHPAVPKRLTKNAFPTLNLPPRELNIQDSTPAANAERSSSTGANNVDDCEETLISYTNFMENIIMKSMVAPTSLPSTSKNTTEVKSLPKPNETIEIDSMEVDTFSTESINKQSGDISALMMTSLPGSPSIPSEEVPVIIDLSSDIEPFDNEPMVAESSNFVEGETSLSTYNEIVPSKLRSLLLNTLDSVEPSPDNDSTIRILTELESKIQIISNNAELLKMLAVKIYLKCPEGYEMLHRTLRLPKISELKSLFDGSIISTDDGTLFASILQYKSQMMSAEQKECILCVGTMEVSKNLYYDIKCDKLVGVYDIDNIQKPEPAQKVLVLTMQGIQTDWKQLIDIAFLSASIIKEHSTYVTQWIGKNITNLLNTGFTVRALVCETDSLLMSLPHNEVLLFHNIYKFYDIVSLLKWFFFIFLTYDFVYDGEKAKHQDILDYIELDSKNTPKLSPKLTKEMMTIPESIQDVNLKNVMEIFSMETAAAMTLYVNLKKLKLSAKQTVSIITKMSSLVEVLYSDKCDNEPLESKKKVLCEMVSFFDGLKIVNSAQRKTIAAEDTFAPKFKATLAAILMLYKNKNAKSVSAQRLTLKNMRCFLNRVKQGETDDKKTTCKKIYSGFRQSALLNILKPIHGKKRDLDLEINLIEIKNVVNNFKDDPAKVKDSLLVPVRCSEYNAWDSDKENIIFLAGFILKKCYNLHSDCIDMKNYVYIVIQDTSTLCKSILNEIQDNVCVVPQENFIEFIEMMEVRLRSFMSKEILESKNGFLNGLLEAIKSVTFPMPCSCFPILYAKKLYLRIRIFRILKHNNQLFREFPKQSKYLVVNNI